MNIETIVQKSKRAGDVAQAREHLPSEHESMSSSPSTTKKENPTKA
jgi:hypothetical protein